MQVERVRSICYQPGVLAVFLVPKRVLPVYQVPTHVSEPSDIQDFKLQILSITFSWWKLQQAGVIRKRSGYWIGLGITAGDGAGFLGF